MRKRRGDAQVAAQRLGRGLGVSRTAVVGERYEQNAWIARMEELLAADHPDIRLVEVVYGDDADQTPFDKTAALLQTYPERSRCGARPTWDTF
jgi:rhamnose transport system substrate-binding protein